MTQFSNPAVGGFSSPCEENRESSLDFNTLLVKHKSTTFCMRITGNAMSPAIIQNDIIVTDRSLGTRNGDTVVAEYNGEFIVRYFHKTNGTCILKAENQAFPDIEITSDIFIFGVVTAVVRKIR